MKSSDHTPRASFLSTFVQPDTIGVEVGCDAGAHAQALLEYGGVAKLWIVDTWPNKYHEGYCRGRLNRWNNRVVPMKVTSHEAAYVLRDTIFDFIYIDIEHDPITVAESLKDWWPLLKVGGVLGYRNYSTCKATIDQWLGAKRFEVCGYHNEIVIFK